MRHVHLHLHRTRDAGTSEGAKKAAATRKSHGGGVGTLHEVAQQHGYKHTEHHAPSNSDMYSHPSLTKPSIMIQGNKWTHLPNFGTTHSTFHGKTEGSGAEALHKHLSQFHSHDR